MKRDTGRPPRSLVVLASLATLLACGACGDRPPSSPEAFVAASRGGGSEPTFMGSPACGKPAAAATGVLPRQVRVLGRSRSYTLVVPAGYSPAVSAPIVFVLHGHGGSGAQARASMNLEAAASGKAVFVYPDGHGGGWDLDSPTTKNGDVALFDAIVAQTQSNYCVDLHRVFIAGFSNGAYMANQLACRRGDRVRAVATHSGGGPYDPAGTYDDRGNLVCSGKPVGSLVLHGAADATVAPAEGQKSIDHWSAVNRCSGSSPSAPAGCVAYGGCTNPVNACRVQGLGHSVWPQAASTIWAFFESQR